MHSAIIYCPHLNRDIRGLINKVPNPRIHTGYPTTLGHDGCLQCHHQIVTEARALGWPSVFVMEDDCQFTEEFDYHKWIADALWCKENGFGCLTGGCVNTYGAQKTRREGILAVDKFHSAHCIVYFADQYERVLQTIQPFDTSLGDVGVRCAVSWPFVAVQRPVFSGILQKDVDYTGLYALHEQHLGEVLGLQ